jgi:Protein of unknown function (DUF2867)
MPLIPPPPWRRTQPRRWAAEIPVPGDLRALSRFPHTDYADAFEVGVNASARTPEEWSRAVFEDAAKGMRVFLTIGWRLLGVQLAPAHTPGHVLGWRIVKQAPDFVVLQARSAAGASVRLVLQADSARLRFATFVRCDGLIGRMLWFGVAPLHRVVVSRLLGEATQ